MAMDTKQASTQQISPPLKRTDKLFIFFMMCMTCVVAVMGYTTYQQGKVEETSKRNGEAWLKWLSESAKSRHEPGYEPAACAAQLPPATQTWGGLFRKHHGT